MAIREFDREEIATVAGSETLDREPVPFPTIAAWSIVSSPFVLHFFNRTLSRRTLRLLSECVTFKRYSHSDQFI